MPLAPAKESDPKAKVLGGADTTLHAGPGHQAVPAHHHVHGHGGRGPEVHQQALPQGDEARVLGLRGVRLGLAQHQRLGSGGQGEVQDHRGLHVQVLQGLLEGEPRGDQTAPDHGVAQRQGHMPAAGDGQAPGAARKSVDPGQDGVLQAGGADGDFAHALQLLEWPGGCLHCLVVGHFEQPGEVRAGGHPLGGKGGDLEG